MLSFLYVFASFLIIDFSITCSFSIQCEALTSHASFFERPWHVVCSSFVFFSTENRISEAPTSPREGCSLSLSPGKINFKFYIWLSILSHVLLQVDFKFISNFSEFQAAGRRVLVRIGLTIVAGFGQRFSPSIRL